MQYLSLAGAMLLPWLGGYLWLAAFERIFSKRPANTPRQIGYGFFIGCAGLHGLLLACNKLQGGVTSPAVFAALIALTAAGGALLAKNRSKIPAVADQAAGGDGSRTGRILFCLFAGWAALHLALVAIEILHRPVFPWDAWLNWLYRAKAWFYSGQIFVLDQPRDWLAGTGDATYNVAGHLYPTFAAVQALWAATALGYWSETLVNLPVLLCGIALALASYGQCREYGLPRWGASLCAYLLLSLPLLGAHLSLAGKADIWMAGFVGLGFIALLRGLAMQQPFQTALGLAMAAMGMATKNEGVLWFAGFLLTLALALRPRATLIALALLALGSLLGWILGLEYVDLPVMGTLGLVDGRLHVPLLGSHALQTFNLWDDYRDNFFISGTWHLLWTFVLLAAAGLLLMPGGRARRTVTVFYLVLLAMQLFMFVCTEQGRWAEDWTAINRLPLHFAPALLFSVAIVAASLPADYRRLRFGTALWPAPVAGLALSLAAAMSYLLIVHTDNGEHDRTFTARDMQVVVGEGRLANGFGVIDRYHNNIALLSSGNTALDTGGLTLLHIDTRGQNERPAAFFWRIQDDPAQLYQTEISGRGVHIIDLAGQPGWQGGVTEIGLIFYNDRDQPVEFHSLTLSAGSLAGHLEKLAQDWRETHYWSQKSVNWLPAGASDATIALPVLLATWLGLSALLALVMSRQKSAAYASIVLCAILAWMIADLRWIGNRLQQAGSTIRDYPLVSALQLEFGDDIHTRYLADTAREFLPAPADRLIITAEDPGMNFQMLRAKYHALPAAAYVHRRGLRRIPTDVGDYVLVLRELYAEPGKEAANSNRYARVVARKAGAAARVVWDGPEGFIIRIERDAQARD